MTELPRGFGSFSGSPGTRYRWARHFVGADSACSGDKCDRLPAVDLVRWNRRNADDQLIAEFERAGLPHDRDLAGFRNVIGAAIRRA